MAPARINHNVGERLSGLEASVAAFREYESEKWHKLAQDLQPLVMLPERMTRDIGKLQGSVDGRINSVEKSLERSLTSAIEKALTPVKAEMTELRTDVEALKKQSAMLTGAKLLMIFIVQTAIAAVAALAGVFALRGQG
jgi:hypothetical protein